MVEIHLEIDAAGQAAFFAEAPEESGAPAVPLSGDDLRAAVREVVWFSNGFEEGGARADRLVPSLPNLLMFLSDVRGRRFKAGVFLGADVLAAAEVFRAAARVAAAGHYLPTLEEEGGRYFARWRTAVPIVPDASETKPVIPEAFAARCLDGLVRRARRTALEDDSHRHETVHDAWLAALRSETGEVVWPHEEETRAFMRDLTLWRAPLVVSGADRAALQFALVPPKRAEGAWYVTLAAPPTTRLGFISLGQAAALFPPLAGLQGGRAELDRAGAETFLRVGAQVLAAAGFAVVMPEGVTGEHLTAEADLTPLETARQKSDPAEALPGGKIGAKLTIRVDGEKVTEQEIQFLLDQGSPLVFFRNRWIEVDRNIQREALKALQSVQAKKLTMREAVSFALGTGRAGRLRVADVKAHGWLRGLLNELRGEDQFRILAPPKGLKATLRDYQLRGASWLAFLTRWGFGPCLADDMGLGKTVQTIAWILHLNEKWKAENEKCGKGRGKGPVLIVAPVSVTTNWVREFRKFAPGLKVVLHQGGTRAIGGMFRRACQGVDVVVTGYSLLVRDFALLAEVSFEALVLDEAQVVKNPDTRAAKAARALEVPMKVALTGTPFENSALDLWSMQEFLNPGLLGARADFVRDFVNPIRTDASSAAATRLRRLLAPVVRRRLKTDPGVAAELGAKREIREDCALSPAQRRDYEAALVRYRNDVAADAGNRSGRALALLTELKLACDGFTDGGDWRDDSGKAAR